MSNVSCSLLCCVSLCWCLLGWAMGWAAVPAVTSLLTLHHRLLPALACWCRHCQPVLGNMLSRIVVCDPGLAMQTAEATRNAKLPKIFRDGTRITRQRWHQDYQWWHTYDMYDQGWHMDDVWMTIDKFKSEWSLQIFFKNFIHTRGSCCINLDYCVKLHLQVMTIRTTGRFRMTYCKWISVKIAFESKHNFKRGSFLHVKCAFNCF